MARFTFLTMALLVLLAPVWSIRKVDWGVSREKIAVIEGSEPAKTEGRALIYKDQLFGFDTQVSYYLQNEMLFGIYYQVPVRKVDRNAYEAELLGQLKKKYQGYTYQYGIHRFKTNEQEIHLLVETRDSNVYFHLLYTKQPLLQVSSPLVGPFRNQLKKQIEYYKRLDIKDKI